MTLNCTYLTCVFYCMCSSRPEQLDSVSWLIYLGCDDQQQSVDYEEMYCRYHEGLCLCRSCLAVLRHGTWNKAMQQCIILYE